MFDPSLKTPAPRGNSLLRNPRRSALALLVAGTALGGIAVGTIEGRPAVAQTAIQPSGMAQKIPDFVGLVKQVKPAVVSITSTLKDDGSDDDSSQGGSQGGGGQGGQQMPFPFPFPFQMAPQGHASRTVEARGSGFIISADGFIVTNNHVVKGATSVSVTLDDGTVLKAKVVGRDAGTDLALLKVKPSAKLSFIALGESNDVEPGQWVIAVGNPFGLGGSVTAGIVSARGRDIGDGPYDSFIQVDAPINRGNSGGPLITQDGKVVGVNTAILSPSGGSIGIGFAIPSDVVRTVVAQLQKTGHVTRGYLGVTAQEISPGMAKALSLPATSGGPAAGALVASVQDNSPAEKAGIKPGDVITQLNGQKIANPKELAIKVADVVPNSKVTISYLRNGTTQTADATVANLANRGSSSNGQSGGQSGNPAGNGSIGVSLSPLTPELRQQLGINDGTRGVVVRSVRSGSPAETAGIQAGDVIVAVGNTMVNNPHEVVDAVHAALKKGDVALRILHNGQMAFVAVSPETSSASNGANSSGAGSDDDSGNSNNGDGSSDQDNNDSGNSNGGDQPG
ncbi:Do family serine endopeptidase [Lichenicola cladoniae]|uniref:Probable periplasmic serine endoprotease DegP-like n=1 Tax=Lichenicola cladoniae TaxID=1484109 RepID=A0A6M8HVJ3_9PROT|nr:Do family serine endopeptidase [Lichenicola cladoniae]NPD69437.1 Do family serine endopeptidase [Acetobacteraceae bacterium]QKE92185.1 Do family serine endopeptidase [Lichenicola cladoniae]